MKRMDKVSESLYEFAKRGRPKKNKNINKTKPPGIDSTDKWGDGDDEYDSDNIDMQNVVIDDDVAEIVNTEEIKIKDEEIYDDKHYNALSAALSNEILSPEQKRKSLIFRLRGDLNNTLQGIPLAKVNNNSFFFKLKTGKIKKIFLYDIIVENKISKRYNKNNNTLFEKRCSFNAGRNKTTYSYEDDYLYNTYDDESDILDIPETEVDVDDDMDYFYKNYENRENNAFGDIEDDFYYND